MQPIEDIRKNLSKIVEEQTQTGISPYSADLEFNSIHKEVVFKLNRQTLLLVARDLIELATKQTEGSHIHYDAVNILEENGLSLVITLK
jgi:hypothetical protein